MSIGEVRDVLAQEFPEVNVSKIRYWEDRGLVNPARSASGYRRYSTEDLCRLRYVAKSRRDSFYPLEEIRRQLDSMDAGDVIDLFSAHQPAEVQPQTPVQLRLTDADVAEEAGIPVTALIVLIETGVIAPDHSGFFKPADVETIKSVRKLYNYGLDIRQVKTIRNAAQREADVIARIAGQIRNSRSEDASVQAEEVSREMMAIILSLHTDMLKTSVRRNLG